MKPPIKMQSTGEAGPRVNRDLEILYDQLNAIRNDIISITVKVTEVQTIITGGGVGVAGPPGEPGEAGKDGEGGLPPQLHFSGVFR